MFKKSLSLLLALGLVFSFAGCKKKKPVEVKKNESKITESSEPVDTSHATNPLTGTFDLDVSAKDNRPVAVMINNIYQAQRVQTGLSKADIIYETEVEGGITRLMAVYKDLTKVEKFGTIRSARYPYVDLALGHDAIYVHHGQDPTYCAPHLNDIDHFTISENNSGQRIKNGLSSEHTLYGFGPKTWETLKKTFKRTNVSSDSTWMNFAKEDKKVTLQGGTANSVTVPFSDSYHTTFNYDAATGLYTRLSGSEVRNDYVTGESTQVKNVFVLLTTITNYPDGYHRRVDLTGGDGFYITNGTYTAVRWSKGSSKNPITVTDAQGKAVEVSAGKSYVCIADRTTSNPAMQ